jgi:hypothetical protein
MRYPVSICVPTRRPNRLIGSNEKKGFVIIEGMIALATLVIFSLVIMTIRSHIAVWHTEAQHYLQAVSIANRTFERITIEQSIPNTVGRFDITTSIKKDTKIPYKHIHVAVHWKTAKGEEKEFNLFGGIVDAA